jgi:membrane-bound lytic murein transglycosylase A
MIAQDTGSAIVGPARADLFFGAGEEAGQIAGRIQQSGRFAMLVRRELGPSIVSASVPLPPAKPPPLLASYAFRPASLPAKPEPSQGSARAVRPSTVHPVEPPTRRQPSLVAARTLGPSERPAPPTKPKSSQVAARAVPVKKPEPSDVAARALQPSATGKDWEIAGRCPSAPARRAASRDKARALRGRRSDPPIRRAGAWKPRKTAGRHPTSATRGKSGCARGAAPLTSLRST